MRRLQQQFFTLGPPDWLKMKNADAPAVKREAEEDWARRGGDELAPPSGQNRVMIRVGFTRRNLTPWKDFNFKGNAENNRIEKEADCCRLRYQLMQQPEPLGFEHLGQEIYTRGVGPLGNLNQVTKGLAKTIRAMADGTVDSQVGARICNGLGIMRACLETLTLGLATVVRVGLVFAIA